MRELSISEVISFMLRTSLQVHPATKWISVNKALFKKFYFI
jgi:hypothetical protein